VLGRLAFAQFIAASHYAYNMMKILGLRNIITIPGDPDMVVQCEDDDAKIVDAVIADEMNKDDEHAKYVDGVDPNDPSILKKPTIMRSPRAIFEVSIRTCNIDLVPIDSSQQSS
jgi:hypothetical protein